MKKLLGLLFVFTIFACSPKIKSNLTNRDFEGLSAETEILVLYPSESVPQNSELIGDVKIGDSGFTTDCSYDTIIKNAEEIARKTGANIIKLHEIKAPDFSSTCYRITANLYRNLNAEILNAVSKNRESKNFSRLPADANYAMIYFYRPKNFTGSAIGYKIGMEDEVIGRVRNGEKFAYKIEDFGEHTFMAKVESTETVTLNVEKGKEYFIRCAIGMGVFTGRPQLYIVENHVGKAEYDEMD